MSALFWYAFTERWVARFPSGRRSNSGLDRVAASHQISSHCTAFVGEIGERFAGHAGRDSGRARVPARREQGCVVNLVKRPAWSALGFVKEGSRGRDPSRVFGRIRGRPVRRSPWSLLPTAGSRPRKRGALHNRDVGEVGRTKRLASDTTLCTQTTPRRAFLRLTP